MLRGPLTQSPRLGCAIRDARIDVEDHKTVTIMAERTLHQWLEEYVTYAHAVALESSSYAFIA